MSLALVPLTVVNVSCPFNPVGDDSVEGAEHPADEKASFGTIALAAAIESAANEGARDEDAAGRRLPLE